MLVAAVIDMKKIKKSDRHIERRKISLLKDEIRKK